MGIVTHHQRHAVIVDSLSMKTGLFLTEKGYQGACYTDSNCGMARKDDCVRAFACLCHPCRLLLTQTLVVFSGVDVHVAEGDCTTEATTPTSFEPVGQSQASTAELEELAHVEVAPSLEDISAASEDISAVVDIRPQEEAPSPADGGQSKTERDPEKGEESERDTRSGSRSVDELLADWREDLEAFQQMEKDEL